MADKAARDITRAPIAISVTLVSRDELRGRTNPNDRLMVALALQGPDNKYR